MSRESSRTFLVNGEIVVYQDVTATVPEWCCPECGGSCPARGCYRNARRYETYEGHSGDESPEW